MTQVRIKVQIVISGAQESAFPWIHLQKQAWLAGCLPSTEGGLGQQLGVVGTSGQREPKPL